VEHPSLADRAATGKAARERAPRSSHRRLETGENRDPVALIKAEEERRLAELLPIRYAGMLASPFAFYRGTAGLMARDLASTPTSAIQVQLCGDAHLSNFGVFAAPDRSLVFDLNDFDETLPGPFEWDVKRLAASFELAARHRGYSAAERRSLVLDAVSSYRTSMRSFAELGNLGVWYARLDAVEIDERLSALKASLGKTFERTEEKARERDSARALSQLTETVDGELRIRSEPPLLVPIEELTDVAADRQAFEAGLRGLLRAYRGTLPHDRRTLLEQYRFVDLGRKVVGVGSVCMRCWVLLLLGRDANDPLVLQVKEAGPSVLEPFLTRSRFGNHGERVVTGQLLVQAASDIFLGWIRSDAGLDGASRDFYVRQLWDGKASLDDELAKPEGFELYARFCGWTLARAHARSGDRVAIAAYLGKTNVFDVALADFAAAYADLAEADYRTLQHAAADGLIVAARG
jgi:uncharacterized protein (DUF2252 family)